MSPSDELRRPDGFAEWIGTLIGLAIGVALAVVAVAAVVALVSAAFGVFLLPLVLVLDEPWWWAWVIGASATVGLLIVASVGASVDYWRGQQEEARRTGERLESRGPVWRAAGWIGGHRRVLERRLWPALLVALLAYAAISWEIWPIVVAAIVVAIDVKDRHLGIYLGILAALIACAAAIHELWPIALVAIIVAVDLIEALLRSLARRSRSTRAGAR